jgi:ring-1,2-phenylacetyl-CoA epoxidase subunit PaaE
MLPGKTTWRTASVYRETSDAVTIVFDTNNKPFHYRAGQFVTISLVIVGEAASRSYSLSSCPGNDEKPSITVKRIENGLVSNYIFRHAEEIESWIVEGPFGEFYPGTEVAASQHVFLIGAGSGITPLFSILKYLLQHTTTRVTLLYSSKNWNETIFRSVLGYLEKIYSERFSIIYFFTADGGNADFEQSNYVKGRISKLILKKLLKKEEVPPYIFVCGPYSFNEFIIENLHALNINDRQIQREYFSVPDQDSAASLPEKMLEVLLHFNEQSNLLEVNPGQTILDAALTDKIPLPYSCKQGTCGVCTARRRSGTVFMKKNFALEDSAVAAGDILLCQAHPLDNNVTIELNSF